MKRLRKYKHLISVLAFAGTSFIVGCNGPVNSPQKVTGVDALTVNKPFTTEVKIQEGGAKKLIEVDIANHSGKEQEVKNIGFKLDIGYTISKDAQIMMGCTDMGRQPTRVFSNNKKIDYYSKNFVIVKEKEQYTLAGLLTWNVFLPTFTIENDSIHVTAEGDGKLVGDNKEVDFEKIVVLKGDNWSSLLDQYGKLIYKENGKRALKNDVIFKGWATWDYYVRDFTAKDVDDNIQALNALNTSSNLIQLDGGWWPQRGDYDQTKAGYDMKEVVDNITDNGYSVGLHFDGFRGDTRAQVFKEHPEYFLKDFDGEYKVHTSIRGNGDTLSCTFFDYSNPEARLYIQKMVKNMREEWKVKYFKVDFMRFGLEPGIPFVKGTTPAERFQLGVSAIREAIGEENYFLGCSAVFGPTFGHIDGLRTGGDIFPRYSAVPRRAAANLGNSYLHGNVMNTDADYIILRESSEEDETITVDPHKHSSLSKAETIIWSKFSALFGNTRLDSDKVGILGKDKKALLPQMFDFPRMDKIIALDSWEHYTSNQDSPHIVLSEDNKKTYVSIFNWGKKAQKYTIDGFTSKNGQAYYGDNDVSIENGKLDVPIKGKDCLIIALDKKEDIFGLIKNLKHSAKEVI
ncbi:alpha-galactosidase [Flammeovirga aprica]|uniref:Alpha-galactosidase n=1 Tax=Flammeovirga aprica JL-4 TaxID=694437 RepID=A0A7X9RYL7_9BACT|nr:alpha-galactosidase [Flammeovirga aprica]NME71116.1 hypothetical protein [Flammeovirga aprica JL-4]